MLRWFDAGTHTSGFRKLATWSTVPPHKKGQYGGKDFVGKFKGLGSTAQFSTQDEEISYKDFPYVGQKVRTLTGGMENSVHNEFGHNPNMFNKVGVVRGYRTKLHKLKLGEPVYVWVTVPYNETTVDYVYRIEELRPMSSSAYFKGLSGEEREIPASHNVSLDSLLSLPSSDEDVEVPVQQPAIQVSSEYVQEFMGHLHAAFSSKPSASKKQPPKEPSKWARRSTN